VLGRGVLADLEVLLDVQLLIVYLLAQVVALLEEG
jgi:hypothetical protein